MQFNPASTLSKNLRNAMPHQARSNQSHIPDSRHGSSMMILTMVASHTASPAQFKEKLTN